ncbi:MAG: YfiR/HmsC family protein [Campylobacterota bacterium]|nr:YfiR/HmsC family protein [Campylobacterota bacterium]
MRYILLLLVTTSMFGLNINSSLLKVHATLVPKLYLMDYQHKKKIENNSIVIALVSSRLDCKSALLLKNEMNLKYKKGLKSYDLEIKNVLYSDIGDINANIYYLFPTDAKNIRKAIEKADKNRAVTFSYLEDDLKYGVMISLNIGHKVKPILNLDAIRLYDISFRPILLNISSVYKIDSVADRYLNKKVL